MNGHFRLEKLKTFIYFMWLDYFILFLLNEINEKK